jgi:hypothetical protein
VVVGVPASSSGQWTRISCGWRSRIGSTRCPRSRLIDLIQRDDTGPIFSWILKRLRAGPRELDDFRFGTVGSSPRLRNVWSILRSGRTALDRHRESASDGFSSSTPCGGCRGMKATDPLGSWMYREVVPHGDPAI